MEVCDAHKLIRSLFICSCQVNPAGSSVAQKAGRNAAITSLMVCCGFVVCWSPNQILFFLSQVGYAVDFGGWFYHFTVTLVATNSCVNPFIYAAKYREFQQGIRRLVSRFTKQSPDGCSSVNQSTNVTA